MQISNIVLLLEFPVNKKVMLRGYKHVGIRHAYLACRYPYALVKRERPQNITFLLTENSKNVYIALHIKFSHRLLQGIYAFHRILRFLSHAFT